MNKDRPFTKAKFAVVDLAQNVHLFELVKPIGFIEEKHGMVEIHLKGVAVQNAGSPEVAADG